jgi:hypothetical protein
MSPWTRRQVRYLESSGSPLTSAQKSKMNSELHSDPSLGHKKKGSAAMAKNAANAAQTMKGMHIEINKGDGGKVTGHMVTHEFAPKGSSSGAFMERPESEAHMFGPKGEHLGIGAAPSPKTEEAEMQPAAHEPQTAEAEEDQEGE